MLGSMSGSRYSSSVGFPADSGAGNCGASANCMEERETLDARPGAGSGLSRASAGESVAESNPGVVRDIGVLPAENFDDPALATRALEFRTLGCAGDPMPVRPVLESETSG